MASVSHQALLMQGAGSVGIDGWVFPLSVVAKTTRRPVSTFNSDGAWLAALAFAASGVTGVQWQQPLSVPKYPSRATPPFNADGGWIIPNGPAAVAGVVSWQRSLSIPISRRRIHEPSIRDPSSYAQAWLSAAALPAAAFLARTSGLDATHINAYTALINGLYTDGVWAKLDVLHVYATQDSTTALLNLVSTSYNGTAHGSPTFTADRGFTGVDGSTTVYIDTGFNPSIASSPNYARNSAHVSAWSLRSAAAGSGSSGLIIGAQNAGVQTNAFPRYSDGNSYYRINGSGTSGVSNSDGTGHYLANRSASNAVQGYKNGSSVLTNSDASVAVFNSNIYVLAQNDTATPATGFGGQVPMASIGSSLSSTDVTNFYNRLRTYMTAVGVP